MAKFWKKYPSREEAEKAWEAKARTYRSSHPLKTPTHKPNVPGITKKTRKHLKFETLKYLLTHDKEGLFRRYFFKHPLKYTFNYLKSALKKERYTRSGDFYFFGIQDAEAFQKSLKDPDSLLIVGFSFCHKPLECPDERFNATCRFDPEHPVCRQCFIGKARNALPEKKIVSVIVPTIYDIGRTLFENLEKHPKKKIMFLITACELSLEMFADFGHMAAVQGIGIRLSGRTCNTLRAFTLAENGIKPGLTHLSEEAQTKFFNLVKN